MKTRMRLICAVLFLSLAMPWGAARAELPVRAMLARYFDLPAGQLTLEALRFPLDISALDRMTDTEVEGMLDLMRKVEARWDDAGLVSRVRSLRSKRVSFAEARFKDGGLVRAAADGELRKIVDELTEGRRMHYFLEDVAPPYSRPPTYLKSREEFLAAGNPAADWSHSRVPEKRLGLTDSSTWFRDGSQFTLADGGRYVVSIGKTGIGTLSLIGRGEEASAARVVVRGRIRKLGFDSDRVFGIAQIGSERSVITPKGELFLLESEIPSSEGVASSTEFRHEGRSYAVVSLNQGNGASDVLYVVRDDGRGLLVASGFAASADSHLVVDGTLRIVDLAGKVREVALGAAFKGRSQAPRSAKPLN